MGLLQKIFGLKNSHSEHLTSQDLLKLLFISSEKRDSKKLIRLIDKNEELILKYFKDWKTVPNEYREGSKARTYVNTLMIIAKHFAGNGNSTLMDILNPTGANDLFDRWHNTLDAAHDLIKENNNDQAIDILNKLLNELNDLSGSGVDKCRAVLFGRLGEAWLNKNDLSKAKEYTMLAYEGCQKVGNVQGLIVFCLQLSKISKASDKVKEEKHWQIVATNIMIQVSQIEEAIKLREEFNISPLDELIDTNL